MSLKPGTITRGRPAPRARTATPLDSNEMMPRRPISFESRSPRKSDGTELLLCPTCHRRCNQAAVLTQDCCFRGYIFSAAEELSFGKLSGGDVTRTKSTVFGVSACTLLA